MKFTVHTLVKNEDVWIWFAIQSVLEFADQIIIFDTGSTDKTAEVIKSIKSPKISFKEKGSKSREELVKLRQEMIDQTETGWFLVLDGDEVWPRDQLIKVIGEADKSPKNILALVNRTRNSIGDVFHYQPEEAGRYNLAGQVGNLTMRMIRKTSDLKLEGQYPLEAFTNKSGPIQNQEKNLKFIDAWYLHTTFLKRSSLDRSAVAGNQTKGKVWEKGIKMDSSDLPEALFLDHPNIVPNPLVKRSILYESVSHLTSPLISIKRKMR